MKRRKDRKGHSGFKLQQTKTEVFPSLKRTPPAERDQRMERDKRDLREKRHRVRREVRRQVAAASITNPGENPTAKPVDNSPTNSDEHQRSESPHQDTRQCVEFTDGVDPCTPGVGICD